MIEELEYNIDHYLDGVDAQDLHLFNNAQEEASLRAIGGINPQKGYRFD